LDPRRGETPEGDIYCYAYDHTAHSLLKQRLSETDYAVRVHYHRLGGYLMWVRDLIPPDLSGMMSNAEWQILLGRELHALY